MPTEEEGGRNESGADRLVSGCRAFQIERPAFTVKRADAGTVEGARSPFEGGACE
jgi:hypothetical protein